jgi:SAM-dependent MidA family methyltransferase
MIAKNKLPTPPKDAIELSLKLVNHIRDSIQAPNKLSFADFMQQVLYTPGIGYYSNALPKIGSQGDFITAPETSSLFSKCIARQSSQVLKNLSAPNIVEFGAGRGVMARDILLELHKLEQPLTNYYIIELSSELKAIQKQTLANLPNNIRDKVVWLDSLPEQPLSAVVLANEVIDAMPIEKLRFNQNHISQAFVNFDRKTGLPEWQYQPIKNAQLEAKATNIQKYIGDPENYDTEVNLNITPWINSISDFLTDGLVLIIDYGYSRHEYYQPARDMGTFRCYYQHLAHDDPFFYPGLQDLTAHVDFTSVAEAGFEAGFNIDGFTTQSHFLIATGLLEMANEYEHNSTDSIKITQQIKTLTMPNEMGESFKVIGMTKNIEQPLIGFQLQNLLHTL